MFLRAGSGDGSLPGSGPLSYPARSNRTAQVVAILTPEQRTQYAELEKTYEQERRARGTNSPWKGRSPGYERGERSHGDAPWSRRDRDRDWPRPGTNPGPAGGWIMAAPVPALAEGSNGNDQGGRQGATRPYSSGDGLSILMVL